jgi:hypothetical protein
VLQIRHCSLTIPQTAWLLDTWRCHPFGMNDPMLRDSCFSRSMKSAPLAVTCNRNFTNRDWPSRCSYIQVLSSCAGFALLSVSMVCSWRALEASLEQYVQQLIQPLKVSTIRRDLSMRGSIRHTWTSHSSQKVLSL